jgi:hypothetical protein
MGGLGRRFERGFAAYFAFQKGGGVIELSSAQRGWLAGPYFVFEILVVDLCGG